MRKSVFAKGLASLGLAVGLVVAASPAQAASHSWTGAGAQPASHSWTNSSWTGASWTGASWTGASWTGADLFETAEDKLVGGVDVAV